MSKSKSKAKAKSKARVKSKAKSKKTTKSKVKAKPKARGVKKTKKAKKAKKASKVKAKSKSKLKAKGKNKLKAKTKTKAKVKAKGKTKAKVKTKAKSKAKPKIKARSKSTTPTTTERAFQSPTYSEAQKAFLLQSIKKIVDLRKQTPNGLRSLYQIDHILDQYNQKYKNINDKFDAIVVFGVDEHAKYREGSGLIAHKDTSHDSLALFKLLSEMNKGTVPFTDASDEIETIYEEALENNEF